MVPRVFSVPGLGCFQFPDSGLMFPEWCVGRPSVFSVPGMVFPVPSGDGMAVFVVPIRCFGFPCVFLPFFVASSLLLRCFFLLLLASLLSFASLPSFLPSFHLSSFPPLLPCFLSFFFPVLRSCLPPSFPASSCRSFNLPSVLPFLASCPCFLPFPSLSFRFLSLP